MPKGTTEKTASNILKIVVVIIGVICTALVFVVEKLGGVFQLSVAFTSVSSGPVLGLFTLGMLFPKVNAKVSFHSDIINLASYLATFILGCIMGCNLCRSIIIFIDLNYSILQIYRWNSLPGPTNLHRGMCFYIKYHFPNDYTTVSSEFHMWCNLSQWVFFQTDRWKCK